MRGIRTKKPRTMQLQLAAPNYRPNFGTPAPEEIQLSRIKLPKGLQTPKAQRGVKPQPLLGAHASATTIAAASGTASEVSAQTASSVDSINKPSFAGAAAGAGAGAGPLPDAKGSAGAS